MFVGTYYSNTYYGVDRLLYSYSMNITKGLNIIEMSKVDDKTVFE